MWFFQCADKAIDHPRAKARGCQVVFQNDIWKRWPLTFHGHHALGEPTNDETKQSAAGKREILLGKLQEGFGIAQDEAVKQGEDVGKASRGCFYIF
jgi:uncharacterized protein YjbJ (UPF0337 family)